ncbi:MAG: GNAT family N-acetyltransferase [Acidimicrobiia bacterium]
MPAPESFSTERLDARRPTPSDEEFFAATWADPQVAQWLGGVRDRSGVRALMTHFDDLWHHESHGVWVLDDRSTGEPVGWVLLHPMDFGGHTGTEIGWAIVADRWREGLASEAAARVAEIAYTDCALAEVISGTMTTNVASRGVMEKIGFSYDCDVEHAGLPHVLYRLDRTTWEKTHG